MAESFTGVYTAFSIWLDSTKRVGHCTCGEVNGHAGWLVCFDNDTKPKDGSE